MFSVLKNHCIEGIALAPQGNAAEFLESAGLAVFKVKGLSQFDNTKFGHYIKLRWLILIREIFYLPFSIYGLYKVKQSHSDFHLIHLNEVTLLPVGILAKLIFKVPLVVHVRSLQHYQGFISKIFFKLLNHYADSIICIDKTVRASLPNTIPSLVIHNAINLHASEFKIKSNKVRIGISGVLLRSKGVFEFVAAANILINQRGYDLEFCIAGQNVRKTNKCLNWIYKKLGFSQDVFNELSEYVLNNQLCNHVKMLGLVKDIRDFYQRIDILCFPSYLNACGRPVFEAALNGIPSIVAIKSPMDDAIIHRVTGLVIENSDALILANAIEELINNPLLLEELGKNAKAWASKYYNLQANCALVLNVYRSVI